MENMEIMEITTIADNPYFEYEVRAEGRTFRIGPRFRNRWGMVEIGNENAPNTVGERYPTVAAALERIEGILAAK